MESKDTRWEFFWRGGGERKEQKQQTTTRKENGMVKKNPFCRCHKQ